MKTKTVAIVPHLSTVRNELPRPDNDNMKFYDLQFVMHTYQENGKTYLRIDFPQSRIRFDAFNIHDVDLPVTKTKLFLIFGTYNFKRVYP